jgi:hypothetical protein
MAKLAKSTVYTTTSPQRETSLDKTTRIVKKMQEGETKKTPSQDGPPAQ